MPTVKPAFTGKNTESGGRSGSPRALGSSIGVTGALGQLLEIDLELVR